MKRDLIIRWIDELESGKYSQSALLLRARDTYSAYGVFLNNQNPFGWKSNTGLIFRWDGCVFSLPIHYCAMLGRDLINAIDALHTQNHYEVAQFLRKWIKYE